MATCRTTKGNFFFELTRKFICHLYCADKTRSLEKDIEKETKGGHRDFLLKFINTNRPEFPAEEVKSAAATGHWESLIDMQEVGRNAAAIHAAGEGSVVKFA